MRKVRKVNLNTSDIEKLIKDLRSYQNRLTSMVEEFCEKVAELGYEIISVQMNAPNDEYVDTNDYSTITKIVASKDNVNAYITIEGKDVIFIEFGAGKHYNGAVHSSPHPKGDELGYKIGEYRENSLGRLDHWTMPDGGTTYGTRATMPMWFTAQQLRYEKKQEIRAIAKEVFGNGLR